MIILFGQRLVNLPLWRPILFTFIVASWPFVFYPFTDGDILHWLKVAKSIQSHGQWLSGMNDQAHGPLLSWGSALGAFCAPHSLYAYALWNILMAILGVAGVYCLSKRLWNSERIAQLSSFILSTSLIWVYMARTPMYDLTAGVCFFGFVACYLSFLKSPLPRWPRDYALYVAAMLCLGLGSLTRFSITVGLAEMFIVLTFFVFRRSFKALMMDMITLAGTALLMNLPWLIGQTMSHGYCFLDTFVYDNVGRFIKEPGSTSTMYLDVYTNPLFVLAGLMPHTIYLLGLFSRKAGWQALWKDNYCLALLAASLPGLLLFSLSGHVKLIRYITLVFPFFSMLSAFLLGTLSPFLWQRTSRWVGRGFLTLVAVTFGILILQYARQAEEGWILTLSVIVLVWSLLIIMMNATTRNSVDAFLSNPYRYLARIGGLYILFFSILTYESFHVSFLVDIRRLVTQIL